MAIGRHIKLTQTKSRMRLIPKEIDAWTMSNNAWLSQARQEEKKFDNHWVSSFTRFNTAVVYNI